MKRKHPTDEYYDRQPPMTFVKNLKEPLHAHAPHFTEREATENEVSVAGAYLVPDALPADMYPATTAEDFRAFLRVCPIDGERYPVRLLPCVTEGREVFSVTVTEEECVIRAADADGFRRGLVFLEDEITAAEGAFLPRGTTKRKPWLRHRITRGYFSPTNRPPKNGDELSDDTDYYPDEYLNRLMHDGTNGLWIYSSFRQLVPSSFIPEHGRGYEKRIEKLNRIIEKCQKYGIKVYIFAIEPMLWPDLIDNHTDMIGQRFENFATMCPHNPKVRAYCEEATEKLFSLCPGLAGLMDIPDGERITSCASIPESRCPVCRRMKRGEVLADSVELLRAGIRRVRPDAKLISWTYGHRKWPDGDIGDYIANAPSDVELMYNFEDRGFPEQLGKKRQAMDYWLAYIGPSEMFRTAATDAAAHRKKLWAKMQICCSHEVATVPYVPVPGNVFDKVKAAHALGVEGIVECWYFGNYPCFMSKAVGELAFAADFGHKDDFLLRLCALTFGKSVAPDVLRALRLFESGYRLYPINIMYSYYSPMHDGVVWKLSLLPKNLPPSRSWQLTDPPDGDRLCDARLTGHTTEEVIKLLTGMRRRYRAAMHILSSLPDSRPTMDLRSVGEALLLLCESTLRIEKFYRLRDSLGTGTCEPLSTLKKLQRLAREDAAASERMAVLCERDGRLGYHSEAEGYKFFPEKLRARANFLRTELSGEFEVVRRRISEGKPPLAYYLGEDDTTHTYRMAHGDISEAAWEPLGGSDTAFRMAEDGERLTLQLRTENETAFILQPEFRLFSVTPPVRLEKTDGGWVATSRAWSEHWPYARKEAAAAELAKWTVTSTRDGQTEYVFVSVYLRDFPFRGTAPFRYSIQTGSGVFWEDEPCPTVTLGKATLSPGRFGWIRFRNETAYTPVYKTERSHSDE